MPIYDYQCHQCGKVSEILVRNSGIEVNRCPICSSSNLTKLVSASYFVKTGTRTQGATCCGRMERCETPPCSTDETCHRR